MRRRWILAAALVMCISCFLWLKTEVNAAEVAKGTCGENLTWVLDDKGVLTISGTGEMEKNTSIPWSYRGKEITAVVIQNGVTDIAPSAFSRCSNMTSITIPESVTIIGNRAFNECSSLTSVIIPEGVTKIGDYAFNGCSGLTSVIIAEGVTKIGDYAFNGCSGLTSVIIAEGVTSIGGHAFYGCSSLVKITVPKSLKSLDPYAFELCDKLWHVFYGGTEEQWRKIDASRATNWPLYAAIRHHNCNEAKCISSEIVKLPTCAEEGMVIYTCSVCGAAETVPVSKTAEHTYNAWTKVNAFSHKRDCTVCGKEEADYHTWDEGKITKPATCDVDGTETYTCTVCEFNKDATINAEGHHFGDWIQLQAPTTEAPGLEERTCTGCGDKEKRVLLKLVPPPTEPAPTSPDPSEGKTSGDNTAVIVLVAVTVVAVCGAALFVLKKRE